MEYDPTYLSSPIPLVSRISWIHGLVLPNHIEHIFFLCTCTDSLFAFFQTFSMMQLNYQLFWNVSFSPLNVKCTFLDSTPVFFFFFNPFPYWQLMIKSMGSVGWQKWNDLSVPAHRKHSINNGGLILIPLYYIYCLVLFLQLLSKFFDGSKCP